MQHYPPSVIQVIRQLATLPGIGPKTAERLALHLLKASGDEVRGLAQSILALKANVRLCSRCFALSESSLCPVCRDPARDTGLICVVERPADMMAVEAASGFQGVYHILQGVLSPMDGIGPEDIRIRELILRIRTEEVREVILATGTAVEGEATAAYLAEQLSGLPIRVTRIASGIPMGGDLKYIDQVTLKRALESRRHVP
ncbi:DNA replication and repair protein RecR [Desulfobotulus alkaliphilus]|uniref:Recombination protein RecR n=1 Tax=Desulfobotulus alkaliphilus TaxID=622671 RepID=A0A562RRQ2_9BACT|nr:recombination mediator RecR [Desulfobotulus alkaliphilus]TWI71797.1 DNA replication and repair protein RecR [Desulfobotulus alkaliphilus]